MYFKHLGSETRNVGFEPLEFDADYGFTFVTVMGANIGVVGIIVPEQFFASSRRIVLKPVVIPTGLSSVFDGKQLNPSAFFSVELEIAIEYNIPISHVALRSIIYHPIQYNTCSRRVHLELFRSIVRGINQKAPASIWEPDFSRRIALESNH
jgi:hypothetical protein